MRFEVVSFMAAQEEVFQMLIILPETFDFDSVLDSICAWPYSYQGTVQMLFKTFDFDSVLDSICAWPYSYQGMSYISDLIALLA